MLNMLFVYSWPKAFVYWPMAVHTGYCSPARTLSAYGAGDLPLLVAQLCLCLFITDTWFYFTHRLMHTPMLYRRVHKYHHEFIGLNSAAFTYCHWLECFLVNEPATVIGPLLSGLPRELVNFWVVFASCNSVVSHSGFNIMGPVSGAPHDYHHVWRDCELGAGG